MYIIVWVDSVNCETWDYDTITEAGYILTGSSSLSTLEILVYTLRIYYQ